MSARCQTGVTTDRIAITFSVQPSPLDQARQVETQRTSTPSRS